MKGLRAFVQYRLEEDERVLRALHRLSCQGEGNGDSGVEGKSIEDLGDLNLSDDGPDAAQNKIDVNPQLVSKAMDEVAKEMGVSSDYFKEKLNTGLMVILDTRGIRILATSLLPLHKTSLQYGSANAGDTVFKHDRCHRIMHRAAKVINLKEHVVGNSPEQKKAIYGPCDIEVHIGKDDNIYILDTARVFPPTPPNRFYNAVAIPVTGRVYPVQIKASDWQNEISAYMRGLPVKTIKDESIVTCFLDHAHEKVKHLSIATRENIRGSLYARRKVFGTVVVVNVLKGAHLYQMMRPELVKVSKKPLSSDAFSFFGTDNAKSHNSEVREMFNHMMEGTYLYNYVYITMSIHIVPHTLLAFQPTKYLYLYIYIY